MAINDQNKPAEPEFWMNMLAESIYTSGERRTKAVEVLKSTISWAFGLISTGGLVLTLFGPLKELNQWAMIFLGAAFCALTYAYGQAARALFPVPQTTKLADTTEMVTAYSNSVKVQQKQFNRAATVTAVGFSFLALALFILFSTARDNKSTAGVPPSTLVIKSELIKRRDSVFVPVTILCQRNAAVDLSIAGIRKRDTLTFHQVLLADTAGRIYYGQAYGPKDTIAQVLINAIAIQREEKDTTTRLWTTVHLKF